MAAPDIPDAVPRTRNAVRDLLAAARAAGHLRSGQVAVAVSGGADSLALAAATAYLADREELTPHGLIVDHGLQDGSAEVAARTADTLRGLGFENVRVLPVRVAGPGGLEAAARRARYAVLRAAVPAPDALVLLGHTLDDQAETVLLGLGRGSGPRSIAGMRPLDPPWGRPLLGLSRPVTRAACARLGLSPWDDPHNVDPRFTRVRLRTEVLPLLEDVLSGGVAEALARTAGQLREDADALDGWARRVVDATMESQVTSEAPGSSVPDREPVPSFEVKRLTDLPVAVRRRVLRLWLLANGVPELTDAHLRAADDLIGRWRGQGGVWLPGGLVVRRTHGRLLLNHADR